MQLIESITWRQLHNAYSVFSLCNLQLTNASLNGGWVPETSRSFQHWQPVPRWRLLPWPANAENQAMNHYVEEDTGTRHTELKVERRREEKGNAWRRVTMQNNAHCKRYGCEGCQPVLGAHGTLVHAHIKAPMTTKATWAFFVLLGDLAFERQRGWSSLCFDADLSAFGTEQTTVKWLTAA